MARRKSGGGGGGGGSWLDTYADMVTLLLTFFVMLFSMSTIKEEEWQKLLMAFQNTGTETDQVIVPSDQITGDSTGENTGSPPQGSGGATEDETLQFDALFEYLSKYVEENDLTANIEVTEGEQSVYIRFNDAIFFNPDSSYLRKDSKTILDFLGDALKQVEDQLQLAVIAGHTAWVDGDYPVSDWRLSGDRAASVAIYLEDKGGIDGKKLQACGYGAKYPVADNADTEGRKKNRRVEMMILGDKAKLDTPEVIDYFLKGTYDANIYPAEGGPTDIMVPPNAVANPDGTVTEGDVGVASNVTPPAPASSAPLPVSSAPPPASSAPPPASSAPPPVSSAPPPVSSAKPPVSSAKPAAPGTSSNGGTGGMLSPPKNK